MFAVRLNGLGENKYLTNAQGEIKLFEDGSAAELVLTLFSDYFGAEVVPSPLPGVGAPELPTLLELFRDAASDEVGNSDGKFTAKKNDETGKWGVWNNTTQKWGGENMTSREQARTLARILNSQTPVGV
jgi:hypothetical protein